MGMFISYFSINFHPYRIHSVMSVPVDNNKFGKETINLQIILTNSFIFEIKINTDYLEVVKQFFRNCLIKEDLCTKINTESERILKTFAINVCSGTNKT